MREASPPARPPLSVKHPDIITPHQHAGTVTAPPDTENVRWVIARIDDGFHTRIAARAPGDQFIVPEPAFTLYGLTGRILGAEVVTCRLHPEDFSLPVEEILQLARLPRAKVLVLCTPNNPTGNSFPLTEIRRLLQVFPGLVVIDEAYHEFSRQDAKPLLHEFENVVILRTFSKAPFDTA